MMEKTYREIHMPYKHRLCRHPLYNVWGGFKARCGNPNATGYHNYGGRGITVDPEWQDDFQSFYNWAIENGYEDGLQLDRIDNDGNYCPENCKWSTKKEQANNRRTNRSFSHLGKVYPTIKSFCDENRLHYRMFRTYIDKLNMPVDRAMQKCNLDFIESRKRTERGAGE